MRLFFMSLTLIACSDYEISPRLDPSDGPDVTEPDEDGAACADAIPEPYTAGIVDECAREPEIGSFDPVVEWTWTGNPIDAGFDQIMAAPVVANLTDDNGDGVVDDLDVPDIVFTTFAGGSYNSTGAVVAISGADGSTLWSVRNAGGHLPYASSGVAIADLEGDGRPAVLVSSTTGLLCLDRKGHLRWHAEVPVSGYGHPAAGDMDGDGLGWAPAARAPPSTVRSRSISMGTVSPRWSLATRSTRTTAPSGGKTAAATGGQPWRTSTGTAPPRW
jgi:hypothetical protein